VGLAVGELADVDDETGIVAIEGELGTGAAVARLDRPAEVVEHGCGCAFSRGTSGPWAFSHLDGVDAPAVPLVVMTVEHQ